MHFGAQLKCFDVLWGPSWNVSMYFGVPAEMFRCTLESQLKCFDALCGSHTIENLCRTTLSALTLSPGTNITFDGVWAVGCIETLFFLRGVRFQKWISHFQIEHVSLQDRVFDALWGTQCIDSILGISNQNRWTQCGPHTVAILGLRD